MATFTNRNRSVADVPAARSAIWAVLTDPDRLAGLTPLVKAITVDGDRWCWKMSGISALGVEVAPSFTERMTFEPQERIEFRHEPPPGATERAGADGTYTLQALGDDATRLAIDITISVELPLPRAARRAVERVMATTMDRTGAQFAENLYRELGLDPSLAAVGMRRQ